MPIHFLGPEGPLPVEMELTAAADPVLWRLLDVVDACDLSEFEGGYRANGSGGRPYDPRLLLVSMIWCYRHQIRSPTAIADTCQTHIALRVLWGRSRTPSRSTIERFLSRHRAGWERVNIEVLRICDQAGLLDVSTTATDSTPVAAPASLTVNHSRAQIRLLISETEHALNEIIEQVTAHGAAARTGDISGFIDDGCGALLQQEQSLLRRLARLRTAETAADRREQDRSRSPPGQHLPARIEHHRHDLHTMTTRQQQACDIYQAKVAAGRKPRGPAPRAPADHPNIRIKQAALDKATAKLAAMAPTAVSTGVSRANLTAPTSRILKGKNTTTWVQGDLLTITTGSAQIILAAQLPDTGNDHATLHPHLAIVADNCRQAGITTPMTRHLADAGYGSETVFTTPAPTGGTLYIAVTNEHTQTSTTPPTHTSDNPGRQQMTTRLATPEGTAIYRRRTPMIEPVFAQLLRTDRHLHTRGPAKPPKSSHSPPHTMPSNIYAQQHPHE
ncbi:MAG: transposase [Actinobacteria bacterium]|nr:transposase [Actinomycetota bacterium]